MRPVRLSATALTATAALAFSIFAILALNGSVHTSTAQAQSKIDELNSQAKSKVEELNKQAKELIERLRHGDLPEGIAKTNGRIEATEVDVSSKYAGRLESVMVDEGDDVKVGQVIARIDSPEYQAQLRTAQANVLVARNTLASAEAKVAQAQADLVYATADLERGKELVEKGWLTKQMYDQRVDRFSTDKAAVDAAEKQRDAARSAVEAAQAEVERIMSYRTFRLLIRWLLTETMIARSLSADGCSRRHSCRTIKVGNTTYDAQLAAQPWLARSLDPLTSVQPSWHLNQRIIVGLLDRAA
jgi:HlyD family secretion protein